MSTNRCLKGEGSWGTKTVSGKTYVRYRKVYNGETKEFYGPTKANRLQNIPLLHREFRFC